MYWIGITFDPTTIKTEPITENAQYEGIRIRFLGTLGTARHHMQIDVGFGDVVYPKPVAMDFPVILDFPAPRMLCYSRESAIAEKLEAMVQWDMLNSRMKDFYDIWLLSRQFDFDGHELAEAIRRTFVQRSTPLPRMVPAFTKLFVDNKQVQWTNFHDRLKQEHVPASFADIVASIAEFLSPVIAAVTSGDSGPTRWTASGPWT
ncbi:MAG: nucleotidyl transferase AbiEii/AbiGii toxin family protein [Caldilineaceae bacterium]|nr:nucleotidyl transferase AbiEii/AbiGii toxin family protein [Caldilineaceae bacterium]